MDDKYILGPNGELYHWGIKGMKWGQRRYQNKDGSLTPAGKKRYAAENEKLKAREKEIKGREKAVARQAKLDAKKADLDAREAALNSGKVKTAKKPDGDSAKPKSIKDMTDDELRAYTTRMQLEKNYLDAQRNLASVAPKDISTEKVKRGRDFLNNVLNDVIAPSVKSTAKDWLEKTLKEKAGLNQKEIDPLKKLENEAKKLEQEYKKLDWQKKAEETRRELKKLKEGKKTGDDSIDEALEAYRNASKEERDEIKEAAQYLENLKKVRNGTKG